MKKSKILFLLVVAGLIFTFGFIKINKVEAADINFVVDSLADDADASLNGVCATSLDECTLRAALEEGNYASSSDRITITFDESILPGTIYVEDNELPTFERDVSIIGPGNNELVIDGTNTNNGVAGLRLWRNVAVTGLKIQNFSEVGIYVSVCDNCYTNDYLTTISSNTFYNNKVGIYIVNGSDDNSSFLVDDNDISESEYEGIVIENDNITTLSNNIIHANNTIGIRLINATNVQIENNQIYNNLLQAITLVSSDSNEINSNNIYNNGHGQMEYWTAGVSAMKYGDTTYDTGIAFSSSDMQTASYVTSEQTIINSIIEEDGAQAGGFDILLASVIQGEQTFYGTLYIPHGVLPNLTVAEMAIANVSPGSTVEAMLQNVLAKSGDIWTYNGIVSGVNGVVVETDGEAVTLATEVVPSLNYNEGYIPIYAISFSGSSSSNILNDNTIVDNNGGILFSGDSTNNTASGGSITSYNYNAVSNTTGTNTLDHVDFDRDNINVISGTLIILPEETSRPSRSSSGSGSSPAIIASFQAEQYQRALNAGLDPTQYLTNPNLNQIPNTTNQTPLFTRTLKYGMTGEDVKQLQIYLNTHGYPLATIGDGSLGHETTYFGLKTKTAVIKFQLANSLVGDGIVGPLTRSKLK